MSSSKKTKTNEEKGISNLSLKELNKKDYYTIPPHRELRDGVKVGDSMYSRSVFDTRIQFISVIMILLRLPMELSLIVISFIDPLMLHKWITMGLMREMAIILGFEQLTREELGGDIFRKFMCDSNQIKNRFLKRVKHWMTGEFTVRTNFEYRCSMLLVESEVKVYKNLQQKCNELNCNMFQYIMENKFSKSLLQVCLDGVGNVNALFPIGVMTLQQVSELQRDILLTKMTKWRDAYGQVTPLMFAVLQGDVDGVKILLQEPRVEVNNTTTWFAGLNGFLDMADSVIQHVTILFMACCFKFRNLPYVTNISVVLMLLKHEDIDINKSMNNAGFTFAFYLIRFIYRYIIRADVSLNIKLDYQSIFEEVVCMKQLHINHVFMNRSLLHYGVILSHKIVELILQRGDVNINLCTNIGTVLFIFVHQFRKFNRQAIGLQNHILSILLKYPGLDVTRCNYHESGYRRHCVLSVICEDGCPFFIFQRIVEHTSMKDIKCDYLWWKIGERPYTMLTRLCELGNLNKLQLLFRHGLLDILKIQPFNSFNNEAISLPSGIPLHDGLSFAIKNGHEPLVRYLLESGFIETQREAFDKTTYFITAVRYVPKNNFNIFKMLLQYHKKYMKGFDNSEDPVSVFFITNMVENTLFHYIATNDYVSVEHLKLIFDLFQWTREQINDLIQIKNKYSRTIMDNILLYERKDMFCYLIEQFDIDQRCLEQIFSKLMRQTSKDFTLFVLKKLKNMDGIRFDDLRFGRRRRSHFLFVALKLGNMVVFEWMLNNINVSSVPKQVMYDNGSLKGISLSILHFAIKEKAINFVKKLLEYSGIDKNACYKEERNGLWLAVLFGNIEMVKLLVENGVDKRYVRKEAETKIAIAEKEGNKVAVQNIKYILSL